MTNDDIQNIFFLECEESLAAAENGLIDCRDGIADGDTVNCIFRAVHSIKGGAGAFGFTALQAFTHKFETVLSFVRDGVLPLGEALNNIMLRAFDTLTDHVAAARGEADLPDDAAMSAELEDIAAKAESGAVALSTDSDAPAPVAEAAPADDGFDLDFDLDSLINAVEDEETVEEVRAREAAAAWKVVVKPKASAMTNGGEPLLMLRELVALGGECVNVDTSGLPMLERMSVDDAYLCWTYSVPATVEKAQIEDIFDFFGDDFDIVITEGTVVEPDAATPSTAPEPAAPALAVPEAVSPKPEPSPAVKPVEATPSSTVTAAAPEPAKPPAAPAAPAGSATKANAAGQTIRVDLLKLDRLIDTVGELVIAQAMMAQRLSDHGLNAIDEITMLDQLTREIQDSAMSIRAQPIGSVFSRVPRIVRELEAETGKRVRLEVTGETTELDKTVVERLGEPLTHLIRNAVDHGLETPDVRTAAGKQAEGVLKLSAEQRSGRILISIADDGAGINRERVYAKAVEKELIAPDAQLTDEEIDHLIFMPGFSTAQTVSNISGRGVGMDVVRQNVKELGGRISIQSTPGKGSVFTLALPLTLAISDGMIVSVGDQTLIVPLTHVVESMRPEGDQLRPLGNGRYMLDVRGAFLPVIPIDAQVGATGATTNANNAVLIVVETEANGPAVLMVDSILDQRQFVIKSLESNYRPVPCVAGATILGDGKVALILDVDSLVSTSLAGAVPVKKAA